jgi:DNA-binding NtrC family response regulator
LLATLTRFQGDKKRTAKVLGISLKTLYNRLHAYDELGRIPTDARSSATAAASALAPPL